MLFQWYRNSNKFSWCRTRFNDWLLNLFGNKKDESRAWIQLFLNMFCVKQTPIQTPNLVDEIQSLIQCFFIHFYRQKIICILCLFLCSNIDFKWNKFFMLKHKFIGNIFWYIFFLFCFCFSNENNCFYNFHFKIFMLLSFSWCQNEEHCVRVFNM